jgi:hypothetical protein
MRIQPTSLTIVFLTVVAGGLAVVDWRLQQENQQLRAVNYVLNAQVQNLIAKERQRQQLQRQDADARKGIDQEFQGIDASKVHRTIDW